MVWNRGAGGAAGVFEVNRVVALFAAGVLVWIVWREWSTSNSGGGIFAVNKSAPGIDAFANALAATEGGRAVRNNNPGNLKYAGQAGARPDSNNEFAIFDSPQSGYDALKAQIALDARRNPGWTLTQYMAKYLGGNPDAPVVSGEGNPFTKAAAIAKQLGVDLGATLQQILHG